ncbi:MAG: flagellar basal body-associated FliL family protein [Rhizobiales bacterium]|nr:flagellar basal body-associated FliL family protein [Hyphomicrobiales bacterium]
MSEDTASDIAEGEGAEDDGEEGGAKKGLFTQKKIFMLVGILALLAGGGGVWFMGYFDEPVEMSEAEMDVPAVPPVFHELDEMTVNIAGNEGRAQFLRLEISLEVVDQETLDLIKPVLPRVVDTFQTYLRELRKADLEGSAGIYRLKEELLRRINLAVYPASVDDVLFRQLLLQ